MQLTVRVSQEDIEAAVSGADGDPVARAVGRSTGSYWKMSGAPGIMLEQRAPYRSLVLPATAYGHWRHYQAHREMCPFTFEAELYTP